MKHRVFDRLLERFSPIAHFEVAEHSFQVPMSNSPLLLNYLCFGARFLKESRLTTAVFTLTFWLGCELLLIKNKA